MERIAAAAVRYNGEVFAPPPPARHYHAIEMCHNAHGEAMIGKEEQGFVTSAGRFVNRFEARDIARHAGQLLKRASKLPELFSEDVW